MQLFSQDVDIPFFEEHMTPEMAKRILDEPKHPATWDGYLRVAGALNVTGKIRTAEKLMRKSLDLQRNTVTLMNLAYILHTNGKYVEAFPYAQEAYERDPLNRWATVLFAESLLRFERWEEGWAVYESYFINSQWGKFMRAFPFWNGQNICGKRIGVPAFEGYGDAIMYFAWVRFLKELGAKVVFYCEETIAPLFEGHPWLYELRPIARGEVYFGMEHFDYFLPLVGLPNHFRCDPQPISWWGPYIIPKKKFNHKSEGKPAVGICAKAGELTAQFSTRTLSAVQKAKILYADSVEWVSLDYGEQPLIKDWSDTAALVRELDMVVTVDTGVAHLAGAMGKPTWVMVNGGLTAAWYGINKTKSPFYPSMRLFPNQGPGLDNSVEQVVKALQSMK